MAGFTMHLGRKGARSTRGFDPPKKPGIYYCEVVTVDQKRGRGSFPESVPEVDYLMMGFRVLTDDKGNEDCGWIRTFIASIPPQLEETYAKWDPHGHQYMLRRFLRALGIGGSIDRQDEDKGGAPIKAEVDPTKWKGKSLWINCRLKPADGKFEASAEARDFLLAEDVAPKEDTVDLIDRVNGTADVEG